MKKSFKKALIVTITLAMTFSFSACGKKKDTNVDDGDVSRATIVGSINENTVKLSPNGTVMEISVEDYNNTSIDVSGIENYVNDEINSYNTTYGNKITLLEYFEDGGVVKTAIQYSDVATYNDFNMMDIKVGIYNSDDADAARKEEISSDTDAAIVVDPTEINVEELAEAGYDIEDIEQLESGELDIEGASETDAIATFTDASSSAVVNSSDINNDSYMMIITGEECIYQINGGGIRYFDKHANLIDASTVKTDGKGKSVIIYSFDF